MTVQIVRPRPADVVATGGPELRDWRAGMAEKVPGAEYSPKHVKQGGWWDGKIQPGRSKYLGSKRWRLELSRGLLPALREGFPNAPERVEFSDLEVSTRRVAEINSEQGNPPLRDYQVESLAEIFGSRWGRIALATNAGKGAIIGLAAAAVAAQGVRALVLTDQISVFQALEEEIRKWGGVEPQLVSSGRDDPPLGGSGVVLAMVPTLQRRLGLETDDDGEPDPDSFHPQWEEWRAWLEQVGMALLDEADRATSDRWQEVCDLMPNTHYRVGFSGSFDTASPIDELNMRETMGPVLTQVKNVELVDRGISARPTVELHRYIQTIQAPGPQVWFNMSGPERRKWAYDEGVVYNDHRHRFVRDILPDDEQAALVVRRIAHGEELAGYLEDSVFLHGSHSANERDEVLASFEAGEFQYLVVTSIVDRGTNRLAPVRHIGYVSGEGSKTQQLQRCGRGLRKWEDKDEVRFFDVIDAPPADAGSSNINPFKYFENSARKRIDLYNEEDFLIKVVDHVS